MTLSQDNGPGDDCSAALLDRNVAAAGAGKPDPDAELFRYR